VPVIVSRKWLKENLTLAGILVSVGAVMTLIFCRVCSREWEYFWKVSSFTGLMWVALWLGNGNLAHFLDLKISWIERPGVRFLAGIAGMLIYTVAVVLILVYVFQEYAGLNVGGYEGMLYGSVLITALITTFMTGREFLKSWKVAALNAEKLKRESIAARYESLRNQVNPHFLFNSLNALTNLIHQDPEKASQFVKQLSEVYRYLLDIRDRELVTLDEELTFLDSYIYLQKIRFGDSLRCILKVSDRTPQLPPLVLQLLFENAIKHNVISKEQPLTVSIEQSGDRLEVTNDLQVKTGAERLPAGTGLENIRRRYEFFTSDPVIVEEKGGRFIVRVPLVRVS
jgi:sensor histidine kinase YesM